MTDTRDTRDPTEGPQLEVLLQALADCPAEFLEEPRLAGNGRIVVHAIAADALRALGGGLAPDPRWLPRLAVFDGRKPSARNHLRLAAIACHVLVACLEPRPDLVEKALDLLEIQLAPLANLVDAERFVRDPDRREELARVVLAALGLRPAGESPADAEDRLKSLDSVERARVAAEMRAADERVRAVREAMQKQAAAAAAAKVSRE